jgi:hypothetical protein
MPREDGPDPLAAQMAPRAGQSFVKRLGAVPVGPLKDAVRASGGLDRDHVELAAVIAAMRIFTWIGIDAMSNSTSVFLNFPVQSWT